MSQTLSASLVPHAHPGDYAVLVFRGEQDITWTEEGRRVLGPVHPSRWATISRRSAQEKADDRGWGNPDLTFRVAEVE